MLITNEFLNELAEDLPIIRPIKEFIHLNLLLPYQHLDFWEALKEVSTKLQANPFPKLDYYREKIRTRALPLELLEKKIQSIFGENSSEVMKFILEADYEFNHYSSRTGHLHECWNKHLGLNIIDISDGMFIKWLSMFLDQGIGHWKMPGSDEKSFYQCIKELIVSSPIKPDPFRNKNLKILFPEHPEEAIERHLDYLCPETKFRKEYAKEAIMILRGWAGLIFNLQQNPGLLPFRRNINLTDFMAVKLLLERAWIEEEQKDYCPPSFSENPPKGPDPIHPKIFKILRACQETLEEVTYKDFIGKIYHKKDQEKNTRDYQLIFCMDDRESSLRHHLELLSNRIETFGTAGHFGIECLYQHPEDAFPKKQCPAPVPAKVLLKDEYLQTPSKNNKRNGLSFNHIQPSGNLLHDWFFSHINAFSSILNLSKNLFFPLGLNDHKNIEEIELETKLELYLKNEKHPDSSLPHGYTLDQMATIVYQQLLVIGFVNNFSPLVLVIGHGATSENNPYFATYGCGACSGRAGSANSRAFVEMANNNEVRNLIKDKFGLVLPDETFFLAGLHDTTQDVIQLYNPSRLPQTHLQKFEKLKKYLSIALYKNARERAKVFKLVSYNTQSKNAQKEVMRRSRSLFETRPEMGHTNVAYAIVGRRDNTKEIIPNCPSFFQSYNPDIDETGKILEGILGAVIPVCSGINLDYFFSRVDNLRFGAGSKLPQNIVGHFGISHGTESDLLFGLPFQMIDQHQPLRLFVMVEQKPEIALSAIQSNPLVKQIVYNNWVHYACFDKACREIYLFKDGKMILKENINEVI